MMKKPFVAVLGKVNYSQWKKLWLLRGVDGGLTVAPLIVMAMVLLYIPAETMNTTSKNTDKLWLLCSIYMAIIVLRKIIIWRTNLRLNQVAFSYGLAQRQHTLKHLLSIPAEKFSRLHRGSIAKSLSDDLVWLETWYSFTAPLLLVDAVSIAILLAAASIIYWPLASLTSVFLLMSVYTLWRVGKITKKNHHHRSAHVSDATRLISEHVKGMDLLRTFGQADAQEGQFSATVESIKNESYRSVKQTLPGAAIFFAAVQMSLASAIIIILLMAQQQSISWAPAAFIPSLAVADNMFNMMICMLLLAALNTPIRSLFTYLNLWQMAVLAVKNLAEIEDISVQKNGQVHTLSGPLTVQFSHVSYRYEGANTDALSDVSFTLPTNAITAIVGCSGAGKSTILQSLMRFSDVSKGAISIAGIDIRNIDIAILLNQFSVVFQETVLFNDTIANNIKVGKPGASMAAITQAAKRACIHEMIVALPEGYDTVLGVSGIALSGGEKQRVAIARAILKDAPIVILDEATASLDPENERVIQQAITALSNNKTVIMIAHRLGTIIRADQIIVMNEGRVAGIGQHVDLINNNKTYAGLWKAYIATSQWKMGKD
jgi:ABC-type multidrug transport system fused ATPase/permease subunit